MVEEVIRRRFSHREWPTPDLLVIDGGKAQVRTAKDTLKELSIDIPLIGLAKRFEEIVIPTDRQFSVLRLPLTSAALHVVERIRDEAHRFAITYHRFLRRNTDIS